MKCFFHSQDLDGHCAGAIVKSRFPECEMIGINYGETPDLEVICGEDIIMVDFSFQPDWMKEIADCAKSLTWIDHHKTALEDAAGQGYDSLPGLREIGKAGCELAWEYFYPALEMPEAVYLLGRYDVWDHSDYRVLPFQYRMRMENLLPVSDENMTKWGYLFDGEWEWRGETEGRGDIAMLVDEGNLLLEYERQQNERICKLRIHVRPSQTRPDDSFPYCSR